jgi:hypothetical protein
VTHHTRWRALAIARGLSRRDIRYDARGTHWDYTDNSWRAFMATGRKSLLRRRQ